MCDDRTIAEDLEWLKAQGMTRRGFAAAAGATAIAAALPACTTTTMDGAPLFETMVTVPTPDGSADAFFVHPAKGRHPAILLWPDIAGLRDAYKEAARRLAAAGYAVLVVNHYYRSAKAPVVSSFAEWRTDAGRAKIGAMGKLLTPEAYASDARAFVGWLDAQRAVDTKRKIGGVGHCMTGWVPMLVAATVPDRATAAVSFHGGGLDRAAPLIAKSKASFLFAIAENDDAEEPNVKVLLRETADKAGRPAEIEVYPARHGWTTLDAPVYDKVQADRAWDRAKALFAKL